MKSLAISLTLVLFANWASGAAFHVDDFEDGTNLGWSGASPMVIPTGGPAGVDDSFLQIVSNGANGPGSRAAVFNQDADWIGDFASIGATAIEFDMVNFDTSAADLDMRVVLFGPNSISNRFTSTEPQTIPKDGIWRRYSFSIHEDDLTRVQGVATYDDLIADVVRVMLRHDVGTPSGTGTPIAATIGLDNVALVGNVGPECDFDADGFCDETDIDLLMNSVASNSNEASLDLNNDGAVNDLDRDAWLALAGPENGFSGPFLLGDANLDGSADAQDLNALALTWQSDNANWTGGNFTGSGTNAADLNALALNWQRDLSAAASVPVPEPDAIGLSLCAIFGLTLRLIVFGHLRRSADENLPC